VFFDRSRLKSNRGHARSSIKPNVINKSIATTMRNVHMQCLSCLIIINKELFYHVLLQIIERIRSINEGIG
jgi:hypothetical protein